MKQIGWFGFLLGICFVVIYVVTSLLKYGLVNKLYFVILIFYIIILLFFNKWLFGSKSKDSVKANVIAFFLILLSTFYVSPKEISAINNLHIDSQDYPFELRFNPDSNVKVRELLIFYDYSSNQGDMSFKIFSVNNSIPLKSIMIDFPEKTKILNLVIKENGTIWSYSSLNSSVENSEAYLDLENLNISRTPLDVQVKFTSEMHPNGKISFYSSASKTESKYYNSIILNLGSYVCNNPCFQGRILNLSPSILRGL